MKIKGHRLWNDDDTPIRFERTRKMSAGAFDPQYLVIHYTAGSSLDSAVRTLTNPSIQASCHIAIGRDGTIVQMVPFSRIAWHAGRSRWQGLVGMNRYSIGIELDNAGKLTRQGTTWRSWFGRVYPDDDVIVAVHKNETRETGWHAYTEPRWNRLPRSAACWLRDTS